MIENQSSVLLFCREGSVPDDITSKATELLGNTHPETVILFSYLE